MMELGNSAIEAKLVVSVAVLELQDVGLVEVSPS